MIYVMVYAKGGRINTGDVLARFNAVVRGPITAFNATYHMGNQHPAPGGTGRHNTGDYGPSTEPTFASSDVPDLQADNDIVTVYRALHHMAMRLTRIRTSHFYRTHGSWSYVAPVSGRTALRSGLELYFPMPAGVPAVGNPISQDTLFANNMETFLSNLYTAVLARRTNGYYGHIFVGQWCHGSCHGSRGRR